MNANQYKEEITLEKLIDSKTLSVYEKNIPYGSFEKEFLDLFLFTDDWSSKFCTVKWKTKKTKSNKIIFQLGVSLIKIDGKKIMFLKTPSAIDSYSENLKKNEQKYGNSGTLAQEVKTGFIYNRGILPLKKNTSNENQLSPQFVMEMMGFPPNWTILPFIK